jgi:regulator of RNase E activity RraA
MLKTALSLMVVGLLVYTAAAVPAYADSKAEKEARFGEKIKEGVRRLGTGEAIHVEVRLRDKTTLEGYISEAGENDFVVVDASGANHTVPYPQVKKVTGNNLSTGARIAIGVAIVAAILTIAVLAGKN